MKGKDCIRAEHRVDRKRYNRALKALDHFGAVVSCKSSLETELSY